jgi:hypothetical protein
MKQRQLNLRLKKRALRSRRAVRHRNQPLAEWWFRRIRASLESNGGIEADEPRSGRSPGQAQETFRWC